MDYITANREAWEEAFEKRSASWGKDIVSRIQTESFPFFEKEMVSLLRTLPLAGKTIGQFCSNNGRELLSLMQSGAKEGFGFDIAANQVRFANETARMLNSNCRFIATNILDIGHDFYERFDLIIVTIGSLCWFRNPADYFRKVSQCLKMDGEVIINEQHPVTNMLGSSGDTNYNSQIPANIINSYFSGEWIENDGMYYLTQKLYDSKPFVSFTHPLSDILRAILQAGLRITGFQEFDYDISGMFQELDHKGIPLSYILEARTGLGA